MLHMTGAGMELDLRSSLGSEENVLKDTEAATRLIVCLVNWPGEYQQGFSILADHLASPFQSVVRCLWHPKLNQIMVGTGNGLAKVYYDPNKSQRYSALSPAVDG